jgi:thiol-disulfide isomerase/thioredoxin
VVVASSAFAKEKAAQAPDNSRPVRDPTLLVRLLRSDRVQAELGLKRSQRDAVDALVAQVDYPLFLLRDLPNDAKRDKLDPIADKVQAEVGRTLTPPQRQRLKEILVRLQGWPAFLTPPYSDELGLSKQQSAGIKKILGDAPSKAGRKTQTPDARIMELLDSDQKSSLNRILGKPFDLKKIPHAYCQAPEFREVDEWINSEPLTMEGMKGKVVALHFFAYGCGNCVNNQPHYKAWHERYAGKDVVVLGVHTPETAKERVAENIRADAKVKQLNFPIAIDAKSSTWAAWANNMWPSTYLIDKNGVVRYWWYGELNWQGAKGEELMRKRIEELREE